jgi:hypothetical protein
MESTFQPLEPVRPPAVAPGLAIEAEPVATRTGWRRAILTAAISGLLLVGGGVAVVSAASPAPSTAPSTTAPSNGGTTAPSNGGTTTPRNHTGSSANCPNMGGSGGSGSGSGGSSTTPSTTPNTAPTPAT